MTEQAKLTYFFYEKLLKKKLKTIEDQEEKQIKALEDQN